MIASNSVINLDEVEGQPADLFSDSQPVAIDEQAAQKQAPDDLPRISRAKREESDQVNRFLFCVLVSKAAKGIKGSATDAGEWVPMTMIVRGVLRSYRLAAEHSYEALAEPDFGLLKRLNERVLRDEIARQTLDRVRISERHLARAEQLGDTTKIRAEKDKLEQAVKLRDRLTKKFG